METTILVFVGTDEQGNDKWVRVVVERPQHKEEPKEEEEKAE